MTPQKRSFPKRGDVYLVSFDPTLGAEIQKTRPALILQNDIGNEHSPITIVAAVTSNVARRGPTSVIVSAPDGGLADDSVILLNQIRSIDKQRLIRRLGAVHADTMVRVDQALMLSLGLLDV
jgi:mRNA interferase MazF